MLVPAVPGLYHCPLPEAKNLMPELNEAWESFDSVKDYTYPEENYIVDVKIHMLMPGMWPCIPNWHRDFVPRDPVTLKEIPEEIDLTLPMFMWLSGGPLTEFMDDAGYNFFIYPKRWFTFYSTDWHRGVASTKHTWRTFIRIAPIELMKNAGVGEVPAKPENWIRRHTQVYLNAEDYEW